MAVASACTPPVDDDMDCVSGVLQYTMARVMQLLLRTLGGNKNPGKVILHRSVMLRLLSKDNVHDFFCNHVLISLFSLCIPYIFHKSGKAILHFYLSLAIIVISSFFLCVPTLWTDLLNCDMWFSLIQGNFIKEILLYIKLTIPYMNIVLLRAEW